MSKKIKLIISNRPPSLNQEWREIKQSKYLLKRLIWRDLKIRYNNTTLGVFWNVLQPLALMLIFVVFLGFFFKDKTYEVPTPIYTYSALCLWHFFARTLAQGGTALNMFQGLITKIYFPRLLAPASLVFGAAIDFGVAYSLLVVLQFYYGTLALKQFLFVPFILLSLTFFSLGLSFLLSALSTKYRDIIHVVPLIIQLWVFASPIMYPYTIVSPRFLWFYNLNPLVGYIETFRWAVTHTSPLPPLPCMLSSIIGTISIFILGLWCFRRFSGTLVDTL